MKISISTYQSSMAVNEVVQSMHDPKDLKATADLYPKLYLNLSKLVKEHAQATIDRAEVN